MASTLLTLEIQGGILMRNSKNVAPCNQIIVCLLFWYFSLIFFSGKEKLKIQFSKASHKYVAKYKFEATVQLVFRLQLLDRVNELSKLEPLADEKERGKK